MSFLKSTRFPYECIVVLIHGAVFVILIWALPSGLSWAVNFACASLAGLMLYRLIQGMQLLHYHYRLHIVPKRVLKRAELPKIDNALFLGYGFAWQSIHAQRFLEASERKPPFYFPYLSEWAKQHQGHLGGQTWVHGVGGGDRAVSLALAERVGHTLVLGTTRVGKTRLAELLINQDIARGDCVIVFDPKGDVDLLGCMIAQAIDCGRAHDVRVFHLGFPEHSVSFNPLGDFSRITEVANRVVNPLPDSGDAAAFKSFSWRFVNLIACSLVRCGLKPTFKRIKHAIGHLPELLADYCQALGIQHEDLFMSLRAQSGVGLNDALVILQPHRKQDEVLDSLCQAVQYERAYFDKITASLLPLLEKLTTGQCGALLSPNRNQNQPAPLNWLRAIRQKQIVYIGLDALSDPTIASIVGNTMLTDLVSVTGRLYKEGLHGGFYRTAQDEGLVMPKVALYCDEFNELIGDEFIPLVNKAGGSGVQVTALTQTWSDVEAKLGSHAKAGQVAGNFNTLIMLRVKELATAKLLTEQLPSVTVKRFTPSSQATNVDNQHLDFRDTVEDRIQEERVPLIEPHHVMQLPKGQAFCLQQGSQLYKLCLPLLQSTSSLPKTVPAMLTYLEQLKQNPKERLL